MHHELHTEINIEAAPEVVWQVLTDLDAYPEWNPFITSSAGKAQIGETLVNRMEPPGGMAITLKPEVTVVDDVPPVFAVTSTNGNNRLEWVYPPGRSTVRIRFATDADWASCTPPANQGDGSGVGDFTAPTTFVNHPGTNDLTYCYSIFVETGVGVFPVATRKTTKGRPFNTGGLVKWPPGRQGEGGG